MQLVIYEDHEYRQLYPITLARPVFEICCGMRTLGEEITRLFNQKALYFMREYLRALYDPDSILDEASLHNTHDDEEYVCVKANVVLEECFELDLNEAACINDEYVAIRVQKKELQTLMHYFLDKQAFTTHLQTHYRRVPIKGRTLKYFFDIIQESPNALTRHITTTPFPPHPSPSIPNKSPNPLTRPNTNPHILGPPEKLFIHPSAHIDPGVYFDVENGPILIDEKAHIRPLTFISGPSYIGKDCIISRAWIEDSSIFESCKIGGEVKRSIFMHHVNKVHEGFIGHSYICPFVNFGALSTNSNLKNTYSTVKVPIHNTLIDSTHEKLGCCIGDYTRLSIGSLINTGSVIGFGCNLLFEGEMYPKEVASFSWGGKERFTRYDIDKFITSVYTVWKRKNIKANPNLLEVYTLLHKLSK